MTMSKRFPTLAAVALLAAAGAAANGQELDSREVASQLAGEWSGQIQVWNSEGDVSVSIASASSRFNEDRSALEVYYQGFAFQEGADGAFDLALGSDSGKGRLGFRDEFLDFNATARVGDASLEEAAMAGTGHAQFDERPGAAEFRAVFLRHSADFWEIKYERVGDDGDWRPILSLQLDRLEQGQRSAAADGFDRAAPLGALRSGTASAGVESDD